MPSPLSESGATATGSRLAISVCGLFGAAGVACLALSAHTGASGQMQTAAHMLLFHAPALLAMAILAQVRHMPLLPVAFVLMAAGVTLFAGDLIARAMIGHKLFAMAAPTGGLLTIAGWIALALSPIRMRKSPRASGVLNKTPKDARPL